MKLSIIIPAYNAEPYLTELIDRLSPQLTEEVELIVIDDGSTIPVRERSEYKLIRQENGGASKARNTGLDNALGDYIAFIDADDLVSTDYVEKILEKISEKPNYIYLSWKTLSGGWQCEVKLKSVEDKFPPFNLCCWNRVYKRSLIGKTRFNEKKKIAEDAEFIRAVNEHGKKSFIGEYVYFYRSSTPDSLTKRFNAGEVDTERIVYYFKAINNGMRWLIDEVKEADKHAEVIIMTEHNEIPELERYAMVTKPTRIKGTELRGDKTSLFTKINLPYKTQVVIWTESTQAIGGIETFIYNFCHEMRTLYDIVVLYRAIDEDQRERLSQMVECMSVNDAKIECDTLIVNRITDELPKNVHAKRVIQMVHTCQMGMYSLPKGRSEYVFVSKRAKETFGADGIVIPNMVVIPRHKRALILISATRLSYEKGLARYQKFAQYLKSSGIPFVWLFFTTESIKIDGVIRMKPTLDIIPYIERADYLVQLSDEESFCYTIAEAAKVGTECITTPLPVLEEFDAKTITLPFDMAEIDIQTNEVGEIADNKEIIKMWRDLLGDTTPQRTYDPNERVMCEVIQGFYDLEDKTDRQPGEVINVRKDRARKLEHLSLARSIRGEA